MEEGSVQGQEWRTRAMAREQSQRAVIVAKVYSVTFEVELTGLRCRLLGIGFYSSTKSWNGGAPKATSSAS